MTARRKEPPIGDVIRLWSDLIRVAILSSDDLRQKRWRGDPNPERGHCYVASEALWWMMGPARSEFVPKTARHEGAVHWWLSSGRRGELDPTAGQFATPVPYGKGRGRGFLTLAASKRANEMMTRAFRTAVRQDLEALYVCTGEPVEVRLAGVVEKFWGGTGYAVDRYLHVEVRAGEQGISLRTGLDAGDLVDRVARHVSLVRAELLEDVLGS